MGFHRRPQPSVNDALRRRVTERVRELIPVAEIAQALSEATCPFKIEISCINPEGHEPIASCGEIVCRHCARIFWR